MQKGMCRRDRKTKITKHKHNKMMEEYPEFKTVEHPWMRTTEYIGINH